MVFTKEMLSVLKLADPFSRVGILQEQINDVFGITPKKTSWPMETIAYTNADTLGSIGAVGKLIRDYAANDLGSKFHLSMNEWLSTPIHIAELLLDAALAENETITNITDNVNTQVDKDFKNKKFK